MAVPAAAAGAARRGPPRAAVATAAAPPVSPGAVEAVDTLVMGSSGSDLSFAGMCCQCRRYGAGGPYDGHPRDQSSR
ncbi:hypothetical protein GCM10010376_16400 [Streptomyces violaceusniger]